MNSTLLIALAAALWGIDLLLRPAALSAGWSPAWVVFGEHLLLTAAFAAALWRGRRALAALTRTQWAALLCVAWGGSALATWLYTLGFSLDPSRALNVVLLQKTQPLFALLLAGPLLGERRRPQFWLWGLVAVAGAALLVVYDPAGTFAYQRLSQMHGLVRTRFVWPSPLALHARQALCALGASALWGAATVAGRPLARVLPPALLAGARFTLALPLLALLTLIPTSHAAPATHGLAHAALGLALIVLLPDLAGMALYYAGLRGTTASVATLAELCYPLTSLVLGLLVLGTAVGWGQLAGLSLLLLAVFALGRAPGAVRTARDPPPGRGVGIGADAGYHKRSRQGKGDPPMAVTESSFDIVSKPDPQEIKNAVQQAQREIETRFDFRGSVSEIEHDGKNELTLLSDDEARMTALIDVLQSKLIKRGVDIRFLDYGKLESASKGTVRQTITIKSGLPTETARKIVKLIKDKGLKVNAQMQDEQVRVTSKSKDDLQNVQALLKGADLDVPLQYTNYR